MKFSLQCLSSLALACFPLFLFAGEPVQPSEPLDKLLTAVEFQETGLHKLTQEELTTLSVVLAKHYTPIASSSSADKSNNAPVAPKPKAVATKNEAASFGAEQVAQINPVVTEKELHSRIEGTLESVNGRTVFLLDNGQVWQQRIPETIHFSPRLANPTVVITRGLMGYKMLIVEADRFIYVKRIK